MTFTRDSSKKQFVYQERSADSVFERTRKGSDKDGYINLAEFKWFSVKENADHCIRPLPPFWPNAQHWGIDIHVHFNIGSDNAAYLCLNKMKKGKCPICEEIAKSDDEKYVKKMKVSPRVLQWIIDRDNEKAGPILWAPAKSFDTVLLSVATNKKNRSATPVDNPDRGTDVSFKTEGSKNEGHLKYLAHKCEEPSSLSEDENKYNVWLEFVQKNQLPSLLKFYTYDHIYTALHGKSPVQSESQETLIHAVKATVTEEKPQTILSQTQVKPDHKFDYTYEQVMMASTEELDNILSTIMEYLAVNESEVSAMDDNKLKVYICSLLKLSSTITENSDSPATKLRNRFKRSVSPA